MRVISVRIVRLHAFAEANFERCSRGALVPLAEREIQTNAGAEGAMAPEGRAANADANAWPAIVAAGIIDIAPINPEPIAIVLQRDIGRAQQRQVLQTRGVSSAARAIGDEEAVALDLSLGIARAVGRGGARIGRR